MHRTLAATALLALAAGPVLAQGLRTEFYALPRDDRRALQSELQEAGLYPGAIDGLWGPGTARAVEGARASLAYPSFAARARESGVTNEVAILLDYARRPALAATLPEMR